MMTSENSRAGMASGQHPLGFSIPLRVRLFNAVETGLWPTIRWDVPPGLSVNALLAANGGRPPSNVPLEQTDVVLFFKSLWSAWGRRSDVLPKTIACARNEVHDQFLAMSDQDLLDALERFGRDWPHLEARRALQGEIGRVFSQERMTWRFLGEVLCEGLRPHEDSVIEAGCRLTGRYAICSEHLNTALGALTHRDAPDYRNSIKESVSAVEALARVVTGQSSATLGALIKPMRTKGLLHPALAESIDKMYGYACDASGVRHALKPDEPPPGRAEARYILVNCSAAIEFLVEKFDEQREDE